MAASRSNRLTDYASVFFIKPSSLGDIVHALPSAALLKKCCPQVELTWVVSPEWRPLLEGNSSIDALQNFPRKELRGWKGLARARLYARELRAVHRPRPELALDFQGLFRSGFTARARGAQRVLGLSDAREGAGLFYHQAVPVSRRDHAVDRYLALVRALDVPVPEHPAQLEFPLPLGERWPGALPENFLLIHPYSRGAGKSLDNAQLHDLFEVLKPQFVVLVGMRGALLPPPPAADHVVDLCNRTSLPQLIWLLRQASFTISVDSGPLHLAAALSPRVLGIYTWSDPRKVGPYQTGARVWKAGRLANRQEFTDREATMEATPGAGDWDKIALEILR